jgi:hypothetical protein
MSYAEMLGNTQFMQDKHKEIYIQMVEHSEMKDAITKCRTEDGVEAIFERFGFGKSPLQSRTAYLMWVMGLARGFHDKSKMPDMIENHIEQKKKKAKKDLERGVQATKELEEARAMLSQAERQAIMLANDGGVGQAVRNVLVDTEMREILNPHLREDAQLIAPVEESATTFVELRMPATVSLVA